MVRAAGFERTLCRWPLCRWPRCRWSRFWAHSAGPPLTASYTCHATARAVGVEPSLSFHAARGAYRVALNGDAASASGVSVPRKARVLVAHGVLMLLGWGVLLPWGAATAHTLKRFDPTWFRVHVGLQITGLAVAIVGVVIALDQLRPFGITDHSQAHGSFGLTVMALGMLQPLNGLLRPHKGTARRHAWEWLHKGTGYAALLLAIPTIVMGADLLDVQVGQYFPSMRRAALAVCFAVGWGGVALLTVWHYCCGGRLLWRPPSPTTAVSVAKTTVDRADGGHDGGVEVEAVEPAPMRQPVETAAQPAAVTQPMSQGGMEPSHTVHRTSSIV